ncbi:MAG: UDP-N-acetylglucosamine 2-epimerase (non-hydrolyzing) [Candidatus Omnitrophica bacterium]|nr:UDP-N-acetylglucosamine 2-epimerase (non-hydrolyzing) [Candidatus Omnitrophota bacterium]
MRIINVAGARPNFMKIAPLMDEYKKHPEIEAVLVHTGQHYDEKMSKLFFDELGIPKPDINLEVGSLSHAAQTAEIMKRFEPVLIKEKPDLVVVVGDVNSTIACALVASKLGVKVAHVEAGLRSFDRTMPEEINRVLTDAISDYLFTTEPDAKENLLREGVNEDKIYFVGNVMIDTLLRHKQQAANSKIVEDLRIKPKEYAVLTLHRPSNVDDPEVLEGIMEAIEEISRHIKVIFPVHPRTRKALAKVTKSHPAPICTYLSGTPLYKNIMERGSHIVTREWRKEGEINHGLRTMDYGLIQIDPLGYLDFLKLMSEARLVLTDSGGMQEETTVLGVPCLTLRENTERPITVDAGTNIIVGCDKEKIITDAMRILDNPPAMLPSLSLWDGKAAQRIVEILKGDM